MLHWGRGGGGGGGGGGDEGEWFGVGLVDCGVQHCLERGRLRFIYVKL